MDYGWGKAVTMSLSFVSEKTNLNKTWWLSHKKGQEVANMTGISRGE